MRGSATSPHLSVVVPVLDERESLEPLHAEIDAALAGIGRAAEVLYVDDGSRDGSAAVLAGLAKRDDRVRVLTLAAHAGKSAALQAGFRAARGEVVATLDADLQNDPADLPRLLAALADGADVATGVRTRRRDGPVRRASSRVGNAFRNLLTRECVADSGCAIRAMRRRHLHALPLAFRGMHRFLPTLLRLEGARVVEVPVGHRPRRHGRSKYGIANRLLPGLLDVLAVRWMQRRWVTVEVREERLE